MTTTYCQDCDDVTKVRVDASGSWFCKDCGFGSTCQECGHPLYARHNCDTNCAYCAEQRSVG